MSFLLGDIGGTKTVLAFYENRDDIFSTDNLKYRKSYHSSKYESLELIIKEYLQEYNLKIDKAVIAIAGPISKGKSVLTNLPWVLEETIIQNEFNLSEVKFLNDLEASAYFIPYLSAEDVEVLQAGEEKVHKNLGVVSPGTGLGEAFMTWNGQNYVAHATEGGHTSFAPENDDQAKLLDFLRKSLNKRISVERVCSGIGVKNIFDFLVGDGLPIEPTWLQEELKVTKDPVAVILSTGVSKPGESKICDKAIELFASILGSECGNLALKTMSLGGIFIGGGIPPKILPYLTRTDFFIKFLLDKGRMTPLIEGIPVKVIKNQSTTLLGCARYCFDTP